MAKRYVWLKMPQDFFERKEIKRLRKIAGGDTYTIIYLKMLLKTLNTNGVFYYDGIEDNMASEIALDIDEEPEDVEVALNYLLNKGLAEQVDGTDISLCELPSMIASESAGAERMRKLRSKQKASQCDNQALQCDGDVTTSDASVTSSDTEKEKEEDKEIEKEKDIEKDIEKEKEREGEKENAKSQKNNRNGSSDSWNGYDLSKLY